MKAATRNTRVFVGSPEFFMKVAKKRYCKSP
jgi:hypothetical protein